MATTESGTADRPVRPAFVYLAGFTTWFATFIALFALSMIDCNSSRFAFDLFGQPAVRVIGIAITLVASFTALAAGHVALLNARNATPENDRPFAVSFGGAINGLFVIGILLTGFSLNPWVVLALLGPLVLYSCGVVRLWRRAGTGNGISRAQFLAFITGMMVLAVALLSPLEYAATVLFSAHMVQHMLLAYVAAPLLAWSVAGLGFLWALPTVQRVRVSRAWLGNRPLRGAVAWLTAPFTVLVLFTLSFWLWHAPLLYEIALRSPVLHALEHFTMFASAFLFWWLILQPTGRRRLSRGAGVLFVLAAMLQGMVLASLLAFANSPLYPMYELSAQALGVSALQDQQLAGMIMRTPATIILLVTAVWLFVTWLSQLERHDMEYG